MSKASRRKYAPAAAAVQQPKPRSRQAAVEAWQLDLAICLGLILAVCAVYSQVGHFFFVTYDDPLYITENFHVRAGLTLENIRYALTTVVDSNWVPLTLLSHMAACDLFGMQGGMHHWVNVVLHALSSVLLFAALRRATGARWPSAFVAFIFALHPLHVESVAWISERKDVLSTFFWFLALYAYVLYTERPNARRYFLILGSFCCGLMSKPMLVTFPFTLLLLDVWPFRRMQFPRTLLEKVPLFALTIASSAVTYWAQKSTGAVQSQPLGESIRNALISYISYIGQMFWPAGLAIFYPPRTGITAWYALAALALIAAISVPVVLAWRTRPYLATGWFWYLGTLFPVIGIVQVGTQSHADRYMYVPMVGLSIILAWGMLDLIRKWPETKHAVAFAAVLCCLACLSLATAQAAYWQDSGALYQRAIDATTDNYFAHYMLGDYLTDRNGHESEAISHFAEALRLKPDSPLAHNGLGVILLRSGQDAAAADHFEAALRGDPALVVAHVNLGIIYAKAPARVSDAIAHYQTAIRLMPQYALAHKNLGILLLQLGRKPDAIAQFEAVERIHPDPDVARVLNTLR